MPFVVVIVILSVQGLVELRSYLVKSQRFSCFN